MTDDAADVNDGRADWKGKAVEHLIAAHCILGGRGQLNVSLPLYDDEGVDLVFHLRSQPTTLAVQVKSGFTSASLVQTKRRFVANVRRATFHPRQDLAMLFVLYDDRDKQEVEAVWLVPSERFAQLTADQTPDRDKLHFAAGLSGNANQWAPFRCERRDLPAKIIDMLEELNGEEREAIPLP